MKKSSRVIVYLLFASVVGLMATLAVDFFENVAVEKEIRLDLEQEIRAAARSFKAGSDHPEQVLRFLKEFASVGLKGKVFAVDPLSKSQPGGGSFLFSFHQGARRLDFYIDKPYLNGQLASLDLPELLFGLLVTIAVFAGLIIHSERKEEVLALRQTLAVEQAEIRKVLEEHEALALLGRMSATLAHELKTPLATISNLVQTLPARQHDAKFVERFLTLTRSELDRTQLLVNNLLAYGKEISSLQAEWVPLAPFLLELGSQHGLKIEFGSQIELYGDRFYLGLLFDNLFRNSRQAGATELRVAAGEKVEGMRRELLIEDNGKGFPAGAELAALLNPFVSGRSNGAGLGLYLAAKLATAHDGLMSLYRPEQGAGVRLSFAGKVVRNHEG